jgi:hypothetical protein
MSRFRLNIDIVDPSYLTEIVTISLQTLAKNPTQPLGNGGIIKMTHKGKEFDFVRNQLSYTVRELGADIIGER